MKDKYLVPIVISTTKAKALKMSLADTGPDHDDDMRDSDTDQAVPGRSRLAS